MNYKERAYKNAMMKKHEEQKKIKAFANSEECKQLIQKVRDKAKPSIDPSELPF